LVVVQPGTALLYNGCCVIKSPAQLQLSRWGYRVNMPGHQTCSHTLQRAEPLTGAGYQVLLAGKLDTDYIHKKPVTIQPEADFSGDGDNTL